MRPGTPRRPTAASPALTAAMAGAVDLAAVQARNEAAARAAEAPPPAPGQTVVTVTEASFQTEVLDRSFQLPVLINVCTSRSPGSEQLTASLEAAAAQGGGRWVLANIDVDENPRIVQALQVRAVPTVFAVIGGQLVPGFEGVLPDDQLGEFVAAVEQAGREAGLSAAGGPADGDDGADGDTDAASSEPEDPRFTAAEDALDAGDFALAAQRYQAILATEPGNAQAQLALGQVHLLERLDGVDADAAARADQAPEDVSAQLAAADLSFAANDVAAALDRLLAALARTSGDERDTVRQRLVEFFDLLGPDDPHVAPARREMARVLF